MSDDTEIVEGWTGNIDFQLKDDDTAADLTGDTMAATAINKKRQTVVLSGDLAVLTATAGKVRLNPDTGDFSADQSPYQLRFRRTTASGVVFYPNGEAIVVNVRPWPATDT
jgi:hypothetical protein